MVVIKNTVRFLISMSVIVTITGCFQDLGRKYEPVSAGFMLDPNKSIAVLSGHNDDSNIGLTEMVIEKLAASGKFKVMAQNDIKKSIQDYPLNVNLVDFTIAGNVEKRYTPYISDTSKRAFDAAGKNLKTDYVMVVWIDNMKSVSTSNFNSPSNISETKAMCIMSRVIAYPEGKIVGYSARWNESSAMLGNWENFMKNAAQDLVQEIIFKTN
jgi:hypothetical protein